MPEPPEWLDGFLTDVYEPVAADFRRLCGHVKRRRRLYEDNYRDVRRKVFAHKEVADEAGVAALFQKGTVRELQQLYAFLGSLHDALWQLFNNGRKPLLRPQRYSVRQIRNVPAPHNNEVQERILHEAERFLTTATRGTQSSTTVAPPRKQVRHL